MNLLKASYRGVAFDRAADRLDAIGASGNPAKSVAVVTHVGCHGHGCGSHDASKFITETNVGILWITSSTLPHLTSFFGRREPRMGGSISQ
ncbi:hypothetical protein PUN4_990015 [Paraburkholderia unamae]|nr:hypothetical protein PUN4_990015 [Paraburkholderia unamae]